MNFTCSQINESSGTLRVVLSGSLRVTDAHELLVLVQNAFRSDAVNIVLDMSDVEHVDTAGVQILVVMHRAMTDAGRHLSLDGISSGVAKYFDISGISNILKSSSPTQSAQEVT